jgi:4'-phosphopantetheinyl transferase
MCANGQHTPELWHEPALHPALSDNEIHIWVTSLDRPAAQVSNLSRNLSPDESHRASRFRFEKDRDHFIVARGVLRALLGGYLGLGPRELRFSYNAYGKPSLAPAAGSPTLDFNLSHSHELALLAFTRARRVGVDLEFIRPDFATHEIAQRFFSKQETDALRSLSSDLRTEGFFNCWTRKEAYVKARGEGLSHPLDKFCVSLTPGEPASLLSIKGRPTEVNRWHLHNLPVATGYAAALALETPHATLKLWRVGAETFTSQ